MEFIPELPQNCIQLLRWRHMAAGAIIAEIQTTSPHLRKIRSRVRRKIRQGCGHLAEMSWDLRFL
jgi:hypothetical protein